MVLKIRCVRVCDLETFQALSSPAEVITYPHVINLLQSKAFLPNRHRHPKGSLVVFETIPAYPGRPARKLNAVQNDKDVGEMCFVKETWKRCEIRPFDRQNHR